jgi:hypothetical protein
MTISEGKGTLRMENILHSLHGRIAIGEEFNDDDEVFLPYVVNIFAAQN